MTSIEKTHELMNEQLNIQLTSINALDTKTSYFMGFAGIILAIVADSKAGPLWIYLSGTFLMCEALFGFAFALRARAFRVVDIFKIAEIYNKDEGAKTSPDTICRKVTGYILAAYNHNEKMILRKSDLMTSGLFLMLLGLCFFVLDLIVGQS